MKKKEIKEGGRYIATVSGKRTIVKVESIVKREKTKYRKGGTTYLCINEGTGREVVFKSAMKFQREALDGEPKPGRSKKDKPSKPPIGNKSILQDKLASRNGGSHLIVEALAGTGKTFTMIVGVVWSLAYSLWPSLMDRMREETGNPNLDIVPSDQQQAVWDFMRKLEGKVTNVVYCAFNRSIVSDFATKWGFVPDLLSTVGIYLKFSTVNSLGNQACARVYGRKPPRGYHTENILAEYWKTDIRELKRKDLVTVTAICRLVDLCKLTMTGWTEENGFDASTVDFDALDALTSHFDIDLNGNRDKVYETVPTILELSRDVKRWNEIDFNDQNWLPIVNNLPIPKCDLIMVDEGQDLPRCKQEFVRRAGRNVIVVGDVNQAIYGFAGADVESIPRMRTLLSESVETMYLTETRRCGKAIVKEANDVLARLAEDGSQPIFVAHESNPEGDVGLAKKDKLLDLAEDGDMVLSRVNAPLVSHALRFLKGGTKVVIRGREFGTEIINFIKRLKPTDIGDLLEKVDSWFDKEAQKESKKKNPSEAKLIGLEDRVNCIQAFADSAKSIDEILENISKVFAGKRCPICGRTYDESTERCYNRDCKTETDPLSGYPCGPRLVTPKGILFSSVHRAKGLEADNVFLLACDGSMFPHPMASSKWQVLQEWNLKYVAVTRAIQRLTYVVE